MGSLAIAISQPSSSRAAEPRGLTAQALRSFRPFVGHGRVHVGSLEIPRSQPSIVPGGRVHVRSLVTMTVSIARRMEVSRVHVDSLVSMTVLHRPMHRGRPSPRGLARNRSLSAIHRPASGVRVGSLVIALSRPSIVQGGRVHVGSTHKHSAPSTHPSGSAESTWLASHALRSPFVALGRVHVDSFAFGGLGLPAHLERQPGWRSRDPQRAAMMCVVMPSAQQVRFWGR